MALIAYLVALIIFVLMCFGVTIGNTTDFEMLSIGLAAFVLGHILPPGDPRGYLNKT